MNTWIGPEASTLYQPWASFFRTGFSRQSVQQLYVDDYEISCILYRAFQLDEKKKNHFFRKYVPAVKTMNE